jgi:hypothetical protein
LPRSITIFDRPFALSMGPQRSATSWLDRYLRVRRDICLPSEVKEVFFFDRDFDQGIAHYTAHFRPQPQHRIITEISTTYFDHEAAPGRVFDCLGSDITLICPLRHPVVRSYSLYLHYKRYGLVQGNFQSAVRALPQIVDSSRYAAHLSRWFAVYGRDKIKFLLQEDLEANQPLFVQQVCDALGIPYMDPPEEVAEKFNVTTYSRSGMVAAAAQKGADWLRRRGLYSVVNLAKAMGLKQVIFGKEKPDAAKADMPADDKVFLENLLCDEQKKLADLLGFDLWADNRTGACADAAARGKVVA